MKKKSQSKSPEVYYSVKRKDIGFVLVKLIVQDETVISEEEMSSPDVLSITIAKLGNEVGK